MKKGRVLQAFLAATMMTSVAFAATSCGEKSMKKANEFVAVADGTYVSAGYTVGSSAGNGKMSGSTQTNALRALGGEKITAYADGSSLNDSLNTIVNRLYDGAMEYDGDLVNLTKSNLNGLKARSLKNGAYSTALGKAIALEFGDDVFGKTLDLISGMKAAGSKTGGDFFVRISESDGGFLLEYYMNLDDADDEQMCSVYLKEYEDEKFICKSAQYYGSSYGGYEFSYYDSEFGAFQASAEDRENVGYKNFGSLISRLDWDVSAVRFDAEYYVEDFCEEDKEAGRQLTANFIAQLGFGGDTFTKIAKKQQVKKTSSQEVQMILQTVEEVAYESQHVDTSNVHVSESYRIPDDVKIVEKGTIPATKKLIVPATVEKIRSLIFRYPQYVEEIVFEDPDNGKLTWIGEEDETDEKYGSYDGDYYNSTQFFLTSYTKVKNFTLPKTVQRINGPIHVTCEMETLDLSAYTGKIELRFNVRQLPLNPMKELGYIDRLIVNAKSEVKVTNDYIKLYRAWLSEDEVYDFSFDNGKNEFESEESFQAYIDYLVDELGYTKVDTFVGEMYVVGDTGFSPSRITFFADVDRDLHVRNSDVEERLWNTRQTVFAKIYLDQKFIAETEKYIQQERERDWYSFYGETELIANS